MVLATTGERSHFSCAALEGDIILKERSPSRCLRSIGVLNQIMEDYSDLVEGDSLEAAEDLTCDGSGRMIGSLAFGECAATVLLLNAAVDGFQSFTHECVPATATTTQTSTATSSQTTSLTSSATTTHTTTKTTTVEVDVHLECVQTTVARVVAVDECAVAVERLNSALGDCTGATGSFACTSHAGRATIATSGVCSEVVAGLDVLLDAATPRTLGQSAFACTHTGSLFPVSSCDESEDAFRALNRVASGDDSEFSDCRYTTHTSTQTTSRTSTQSSTASSSATSTGSTTASSSVTSTQSSTASSSRTSTASTSPTSTATSLFIIGNLECADIRGDAFLSIPASESFLTCRRHAIALADLAVRCGAPAAAELSCEAFNADGTPTWIFKASDCSNTANALNAVFLSYSFDNLKASLVCEEGGLLRIEPSDGCNALPRRANRVLGTFGDADADFECEAVSTTQTSTATSTASTTGSSSASSTVTSSATTTGTTAFRFKATCDANGRLLKFHDCNDQVALLNHAIAGCSGATGQLYCTAESLVAGSCADISVLNDMVGPLGHSAGEASCTIAQNARVANSACNEFAATLNEALQEFMDGKLNPCLVTSSATSTATSSATSSATSTGTSTATSSASTTRSSSPTSSATSTASSSVSSTASSSASTTATSTGTSTQSSTASTTPSSSATSTASSSATTSQSTSATTSQSSTASSSASSTATTTGTTGGILSRFECMGSPPDAFVGFPAQELQCDQHVRRVNRIVQTCSVGVDELVCEQHGPSWLVRTFTGDLISCLAVRDVLNAAERLHEWSIGPHQDQAKSCFDTTADDDVCSKYSDNAELCSLASASDFAGCCACGGGRAVARLECDAGGFLLELDPACQSVAALNVMVDFYVDDDHQPCNVTTLSTTATSTATSTASSTVSTSATSTQTSTPERARLSCHVADNGLEYIAAPLGCSRQVEMLHMLLQGCTSRTDAPFSCTDLSGVPSLRDATTCGATVVQLNALNAEFTRFSFDGGPSGSSNGTLDCDITGFLRSDASATCADTVFSLNLMIDGYHDGTFAECHVTSPSTTPTSTATSTVSSSATTTLSSTASTTQSSSASSTVTTTATSTASSSASSSATSTVSSSPTSSASTTGTSSVTTSASSTASSSASTSATSTASSSATSTVTTISSEGNVECYDFNGDQYLLVNGSFGAAGCAAHARRLNVISLECPGAASELRCDAADGTESLFLGAGAQCEASARALNGMLHRYTMGSSAQRHGLITLIPQNASIRCSVTGLLIASPVAEGDSSCGEVIQVLNAALAGFDDGTFVDCRMTSPSTTLSSTATTSATTTATSTATSDAVGNMQCDSVGEIPHFRSTSEDRCREQVFYLNAALFGCERNPFTASTTATTTGTSTGTFTGTTTVTAGVRRRRASAEHCDLTCDQGSGPCRVSLVFGDTPTLLCTERQTDGACQDSTFDCDRERTSTPTSTLSSTASSTRSSTPSTTVTSSATSTGSSSASSTATSTASSSASTTASSSATTTATSSLSTTASTTATTVAPQLIQCMQLADSNEFYLGVPAGEIQCSEVTAMLNYASAAVDGREPGDQDFVCTLDGFLKSPSGSSCDAGANLLNALIDGVRDRSFVHCRKEKTSSTTPSTTPSSTATTTASTTASSTASTTQSTTASTTVTSTFPPDLILVDNIELPIPEPFGADDIAPHVSNIAADLQSLLQSAGATQAQVEIEFAGSSRRRSTASIRVSTAVKYRNQAAADAMVSGNNRLAASSAILPTAAGAITIILGALTLPPAEYEGWDLQLLGEHFDILDVAELGAAGLLSASITPALPFAVQSGTPVTLTEPDPIVAAIAKALLSATGIRFAVGLGATFDPSVEEPFVYSEPPDAMAGTVVAAVLVPLAVFGIAIAALTKHKSRARVAPGASTSPTAATRHPTTGVLRPRLPGADEFNTEGLRSKPVFGHPAFERPPQLQGQSDPFEAARLGMPGPTPPQATPGSSPALQGLGGTGAPAISPFTKRQLPALPQPAGDLDPFAMPAGRTGGSLSLSMRESGPSLSLKRPSLASSVTSGPQVGTKAADATRRSLAAFLPPQNKVVIRAPKTPRRSFSNLIIRDAKPGVARAQPGARPPRAPPGTLQGAGAPRPLPQLLPTLGPDGGASTFKPLPQRPGIAEGSGAPTGFPLLPPQRPGPPAAAGGTTVGRAPAEPAAARPTNEIRGPDLPPDAEDEGKDPFAAVSL